MSKTMCSGMSFVFSSDLAALLSASVHLNKSEFLIPFGTDEYKYGTYPYKCAKILLPLSFTPVLKIIINYLFILLD